MSFRGCQNAARAGRPEQEKTTSVPRRGQAVKPRRAACQDWRVNSTVFDRPPEEGMSEDQPFRGRFA